MSLLYIISSLTENKNFNRINIMDKVFLVTIFKRFARAFVTGGLVSLTAQLASSPQPGFNSLGELKVWGISLLYAFTVGGIMAIEKASRWEK
jgi:hypothetical protein